MSDATLRELERVWRASGDPADEERWHTARVRAGELAGWAWELVQLLRRPLPAGDPPARARLREVLAVLAGAAAEGFDRALVALAEQAANDPATPALLRPHLRVQSDELAARVLAPEEPPRAVPSTHLEHAWGGSVILGLQISLTGRDRRDLWWLDSTPFPDFGTPTTAPPLPAGALDALARALTPWLLGLGDPLREQAERALDAVQVASPCQVPWRSMPGDDRTRSCAACQTTVYDLSALERDQALALLRRHEGRRLCIRYYRRADGRIQTRDCPGQEWPARPRPMMLGRMA